MQVIAAPTGEHQLGGSLGIVAEFIDNNYDRSQLLPTSTLRKCYIFLHCYAYSE
jgi:hypothetical protein